VAYKPNERSFEGDIEAMKNDALNTAIKNTEAAIRRTPKVFEYSSYVDPHIYIPGKGCSTPEEWIELALAALDQADFTALALKKIEACILENKP